MPSKASSSTAARKILTAYRIHFGVAPPFKVLIDGSTIHHSLQNELYLKQRLPSTLCNSVAHLIVPICTVSSLRALGESHSASALFAKRLERTACLCTPSGTSSSSSSSHDEAACIKHVLKLQDNSVQMLLTRDPALMKVAKLIPGVALLVLDSQNRVVLSPMSRASADAARKKNSGLQSAAAVLSVHDRVLVDAVRKRRRNEGDGGQQGEMGGVEEEQRPVKRRKKAKGPNPLSVKKTKKAHTKEEPPAANGHGDETQRIQVQDQKEQPQQQQQQQAKRRRRRRKKAATDDGNGAVLQTNDQQQQQMNQKEANATEQNSGTGDSKPIGTNGNNHDVTAKSISEKDTAANENPVKQTAAKGILQKRTDSKETVVNDTVAKDIATKDTTAKDAAKCGRKRQNVASQDNVQKTETSPSHQVDTAAVSTKDSSGRSVEVTEMVKPTEKNGLKSKPSEKGENDSAKPTKDSTMNGTKGTPTKNHPTPSKPKPVESVPQQAAEGTNSAAGDGGPADTAADNDVENATKKKKQRKNRRRPSKKKA